MRWMLVELCGWAFTAAICHHFQQKMLEKPFGFHWDSQISSAVNTCLFLSQMSGICDLIPGSVIDATMFNPCGYSMNGMKADVSSAPLKQLFCRCRPFGSCDLFLLFLLSPTREHTGLFTSPRNQSSPTSASRPTSPKRPTMILSGELLTSSSQENSSPRFLSIRCVPKECLPRHLCSRVQLCDWNDCLSRAPNVAASFLQPRSLRATSVLTASWPSSTITILSSQVTPSTASRTNRAEAAWWRGGKREEAVLQTPILRPSASASPPGVATVAQVAPGLRRPPALIYPPALVVCIVLAVTWISCMKSLLSVLLF